MITDFQNINSDCIAMTIFQTFFVTHVTGYKLWQSSRKRLKFLPKTNRQKYISTKYYIEI
jgi:hypothetical protein